MDDRAGVKDVGTRLRAARQDDEAVTKAFDPFDYSAAAMQGEADPDDEAGPRRRGKHARGFLQVPAQIMARLKLKGVSMPAWRVLCVLQRLEFEARKKGEPITLSNKALMMFGVPRKVKLRALDELVAREFILPYTRGRNRSCPRVRMNLKLQG